MNKYVKGDQVCFSSKEHGDLKGEIVSYNDRNEYYTIKIIDGQYKDKMFTRKFDKMSKIGEAKTLFNIHHLPENIQRKSPSSTFTINQRFQFLENMVRMVIKGTCVSMIITGEGGLGKTYTVLRQIENKNLVKKAKMEAATIEGDEEEMEEISREDYDFVHVKGFSTAKGLYRILFENRDKLIVFDDCDEVLRNDVAKNILKGALDSYDERIITWMVSKSNFSGDGLPDSFEFTGRVIFISNLSQDRIDEAILSRCMSVDVTMSISDKIERMRTIMPNIKTTVPMELKEECLKLIEDHKEQCANLNLRTFLKVISIRIDSENGEDWRNMAIYTMTSTVS